MSVSEWLGLNLTKEGKTHSHKYGKTGIPWAVLTWMERTYLSTTRNLNEFIMYSTGGEC